MKMTRSTVIATQIPVSNFAVLLFDAASAGAVVVSAVVELRLVYGVVTGSATVGPTVKIGSVESGTTQEHSVTQPCASTLLM